MLQNNPELKSKIGQLWNKFWSGGISNPLTAIEQITYLLFMKRLDELDQKKLAELGIVNIEALPRPEGAEPVPVMDVTNIEDFKQPVKAE